MSALFAVCTVYGQEMTTFTKNDGINALPVTTTFVDSRGIVWFGTTDGVNACTGSKWYSVKQIENSVTGEKQQLKEVLRIYEDRHRNVWFVTGYGVFIFDGTYWVNYISNEDEDDYNANLLFEDRRGWIWVTQEYRKEFQEVAALGYTLLSGSVKMFNGANWYKFDDEVAESVASRFNVSPTYFTDVIQDGQGNMWFATLEGLYMFNGKEWEQYKEKTFRVKKVYDIEESKSGDIWAATEAGIAKFADGTWTVYSKKDGLSGNAVYRLQEDRDGRIWAFSRSDLKYTGLSLYQDGKWTYFDPDRIGLKGKIESLIDYNNEVIVYTTEGIAKHTSSRWHVFRESDGLSGDDFALLYRDKNKDLWTANEIALYKYQDGKWIEMFNPGSKWQVHQVYAAEYDNVWVGTDKSGIYHFDGDKWNHYDDRNSLKDNEVFRIFEDKSQNIWVTTKKGITRFSFAALNLKN
jgi:ligand-binding sensor domain-containing protein